MIIYLIGCLLSLISYIILTYIHVNVEGKDFRLEHLLVCLIMVFFSYLGLLLVVTCTISEYSDKVLIKGKKK